MELDELMREKMLAYLREEVNREAFRVVSYNSRVASDCFGMDDECGKFGCGCGPVTWFEVSFEIPSTGGRRRILTHRLDCSLSQLIQRLDVM